MTKIQALWMGMAMTSIVLFFSSCNTDPCLDKMCSNGGVCVEGTCQCETGFSGENCEIEDKCLSQKVNCQNGGACTDGTCDCPDDYIGTHCEKLNPGKTQQFLDSGKTPKMLFDGGVPLDSIYGKQYAGGRIFYLDTTSGKGIVAAENPPVFEMSWSCQIVVPGNGTEIGAGFDNNEKFLQYCGMSGAIGECHNLYFNAHNDWYIPSRDEIELIYLHLHKRGLGGYSDDLYWSSSIKDTNQIYGWSFKDGISQDLDIALGFYRFPCVRNF
ncbi:hypothetical protein KFE98_10285 [bacterium SCSIO 12741]|nr:hypothetical protein KFE98_10285 [bacterium SCSIO 12741]